MARVGLAAHVGTRSLAEVEALALKCRNWGRWGPEDELGTLNFVTPERIAAATSLVETGRVVSMGVPLGADGPQVAGRLGRFNPHHFMTRTGADSVAGVPSAINLDYADDVLVLPLQCGTQWDALSHVFHNGKMWNGWPMDLVNSQGAQRNSIVAASSRLVGRGVLLDIAAARGVISLDADDLVGVNDLELAESTAGVVVGPGDFVIIRTGWMEATRPSGWVDYIGPATPGLGLDTASWFFDRQVAAVASDTHAVEVRPSETTETYLPWHQVVIANMGLTVGEIFDVSVLAEACRETKRHAFLLVASGLPVRNAVGTPANPLAVF